MPVETGVFVAGVGILVTLDLAVLSISIKNARLVADVPDVKERAREAEDQAQEAHERLTEHVRDVHGEPRLTAREAYRADEDRRRNA